MWQGAALELLDGSRYATFTRGRSAGDLAEGVLHLVPKTNDHVWAIQYCVQVSPYDCTGCQLCVGACPDGALVSLPIDQVLLAEDANWQFAKALPERTDVLDRATVKGSQFVTPLLEVSGCNVIPVNVTVLFFMSWALLRGCRAIVPTLALPSKSLCAVQWGMRGLRRDQLRQAAHPAVRGASHHRQCLGLLLGLGRRRTLQPVHHQCGWSGSCLGQLPV